MEKKGYFSEFAIASLIIGILSFLQLLALEKAFCAIALGLIALNRIAKNPQFRGKNLAVAGIILGIIYVIALSVIIGLNPGIFSKVAQILRK